MPPPCTKEQQIEVVAEALYANRFEINNGSWRQFCLKKPDVAKIFRENAEVAIDALAKMA